MSGRPIKNRSAAATVTSSVGGTSTSTAGKTKEEYHVGISGRSNGNSNIKAIGNQEVIGIVESNGFGRNEISTIGEAVLISGNNDGDVGIDGADNDDYGGNNKDRRRKWGAATSLSLFSMTSAARKRAMVDWIQRQRLPQSLSRRLRRTKDKKATDNDDVFNADADNDGDDDDREDDDESGLGVRIIVGLDSVVFGTSSAADSVRIVGVKPPRYLWYMLSGSLCDVIQFGADVALHYVLHVEDPSLCWALGFVVSIFFRHTSHRYLVFGDYVGGYYNSLLRMYGGYSIIIVLSTVFNIFMTKIASFSHYVAWILTLLWTGIANYFILKKVWTFGGGGTPSPTAGATSKLSSSSSMLPLTSISEAA